MRGQGEEHLITVSKELHWLPMREWIHHKKTTSRISSGVKLGHSRTVLAKKRTKKKKKKEEKEEEEKTLPRSATFLHGRFAHPLNFAYALHN